VRAETLLVSRADELIATRDEAVQATKAKNVFLSSTSHELRTPLNSVLHLPDAGGGQILGWLRAAPQTAAIPVLMVSGDSGGLAADELLALGAADILTKPVDIHLILATVGRYLT
jgi:CheY-like chemotaxis protein